jgi:hypothetical protein
MSYSVFRTVRRGRSHLVQQPDICLKDAAGTNKLLLSHISTSHPSLILTTQVHVVFLI